jgi:heat shock protein HtpX
MHFAITRKREFIADAAAAQFIGRPWALASALKKIHENGYVDGIDNEDLAGMFISDPCDEAGPSRDRDKEHWTDRLRTFNGMMATHPDIRLRIRVLEQLDERTDVAYKTKTTVFK